MKNYPVCNECVKFKQDDRTVEKWDPENAK